jgi:hypothetical protein
MSRPKVSVTAVASDGVRALDALRVDDPGAGLGIAALLHPGLLPQRGQHHLGDLGLLPLFEIPVHVCHGGKSAGRYRQAQPVRTTYKIPSTMDLRGFFFSRPPVLGAGSSDSTSAHCSSVKSEGYRRCRDARPP